MAGPSPPTVAAACRCPRPREGADLIFNAWNPPYSQWQATVPGLTAQVIAAAKATGAAVMIPGNVYVFGRDLPEVLTPDTPHAAAHPLGRIRVELEAAYRASGVKTVILRAGDFLDTEASGNWFDRIIAAKIGKGRLSYPGPLDRMHAWAYLPDLADAFAGLADRLDALPQFTDLAFPGYAMTGEELAAACEAALGRSLTLGRMSWLPVQVARPFWAEAKHLLEMRYLWDGHITWTARRSTGCCPTGGRRPWPRPCAGCWRRLPARRRDRPRSACGRRPPRPFRR
jgi:nucleoside-diphosphate-sugar epimerase